MKPRKYDLMKKASFQLEEAEKAMQDLMDAESNEEWKRKYEAKLFMLREMHKDISAVTGPAENTWNRISYKIIYLLKKEELVAIVKASCEGKIYTISTLDQMFKDYPEDTVAIIKSINERIGWGYDKWFYWHSDEKVLECHDRLRGFIYGDRSNNNAAFVEKRIEKLLNDDTLAKKLGYKENTIERFRKTVDWDHKMK